MTAAPINPSSRNGSVPDQAASPGPDARPAEAISGSRHEASGWGSSSVPLPQAQRPPAPPPPPGWSPAPVAAPVVVPEEGTTDTRPERRHARHRLGGDPPARIALANRQPVFVTLNDISPGGCCIVRRGQLELSNGDTVIVDIWMQDIEMKLSIHARVCWCSHQDSSSRAGLRFVETNHRLLRQIEAYVQHFQRPHDESRPQAKLPVGSASSHPQQHPIQPDHATSPGLNGRHRRRSRDSRHPRDSQPLTSMPRPGRLTSLDLQRRMRPAHRLEVARIAEETGIHISTLYGWLRTLRLEGDVDPQKPRDPQAWSATDKVSALLQVVGMSAAERSDYCRRHGISDAMLDAWRQAALQANEKPLLILRAEEELQRLRVHDQREIRRLHKELRRRERSAAISDELLQVVRKLQILWEQGDGH